MEDKLKMPPISLRSILRVIAILLAIVTIIFFIVWFKYEPGFASLGAVLSGLTTLVALIWSCFASDKPVRIPVFEKDSSAKDTRNRENMLKLVKNTWITGFLDSSLHGAALIALGLEERRDAVKRPWDMVLQTSDQPHRKLPKGTKIMDFFDEIGHKLLIMGEPGSGKTTMMLDFVRDAIDHAEKDPDIPIPVVLNLSGWAEPLKPFDEWLVDELNTKYLIPEGVARSWVEKDELLLLLDGLDEVALDRREACVTAINDFLREHFVPIMVCSRIADYEALNTKLKFQSALLLQPLTPQQVNAYLDGAGPELAAVRTTLKKDPVLMDFARTPLWLSIMTLAYRGLSVEEVQTLDTPEKRQTHIFDTYVQQMFKHRGGNKRYSQEQTLYWLSWLAQKMSQHAQSVFLIERMQPEWLSMGEQQQKKTIGKVALISGLVGGLAVGLVFGLIFGLLFLMIGIKGIEPIEMVRWSWSELRSSLFTNLYIVLIGELIVGLAFGLLTGLLGGLLTGLLGGLLFGLFLGLRFGGYACIQHLVLRFLLYCKGYIPLDYVRFLDYAAERIFLRKVGGGYIFVHGLLKDYFATLETGRKIEA